jgi:GLPGLI family protein
MKRIFFSLLLVLSLQTVSAQGFKIVYEEVTNKFAGRDVSKDFEHIDNPEVRALMENMAKSPTVRTAELLVNREASLYTRSLQPKKEEEPVSSVDGKPKGRIVFGPVTGTSAVYKSYTDSVVITQMDVGDKKYLLESPTGQPQNEWQITSEQTEILGYSCIKAVKAGGEVQKIGNATITPLNIVAWYCPDIPVNAGPEIYSGLPGLILKLESGDGRQVYTAVSAEPLEPATEIPKPENGEKVSIEEFFTILSGHNAKNREKMEQQGAKVIQIQR